MTNHEPPDDTQLARARELGYEPRDIHLFGVAMTGVALFLLVVGSLVVMWWLIGILAKDEPRGLSEQLRPIARPEQKHVNQQLMREANEAEQRKTLDSYGWIDRETKVARIPIKRAMEMMAKQGEVRLP